LKQRIYIDTSIAGGYFESEFQEYSKLLIQDFYEGKSIAVISDLTMLELQRAPRPVQEIIEKIPISNVQLAELSDEAKRLANEYLAAGVIGQRFQSDAQHIAIATISRVNLLVSWNFKHIVNIVRIRGYNSVNIRLGYPILEIRTPREAVEYE